MKILHAVHGFAPEFDGGVERYVSAVAAAAREAGHDVRVLAGSDEEADPPSLRSETVSGLPIVRLVGGAPHSERGRDRPELSRLVGELLDEFRPDLLHIHSWLRLVPDLAALAAWRGIPVAATLHDLGTTCGRIHRLREGMVFCREPESPGLCTPCVRRDAWESDDEVRRELEGRQGLSATEREAVTLALVPSEAQRSMLVAPGSWPADRLRILPPAMPASIRNAPPPPSSDERHPLRIGHWGNLLPAKGTDLLLEALSSLPLVGGVEIHLWGRSPDPEFDARLRRLAELFAAPSRVVFHGAYGPADLAAVALDLAVFPSLAHESHSFVLDEAFELGLPVVVSDRGAPPARVGKRGVVVPAGDVGALAAVVAELARDRARLLEMRKSLPAGPAVDWDAHVARLASIWQETAQQAKTVLPDDVGQLRSRLEALGERAERRRRDAIAARRERDILEVRASSEVAARDAELSRLYVAERDLRAEVARRDVDLTRRNEEEAALRAELAKRDAELSRLYGSESALRGELEARDRELTRLYAEEAALRRELDLRDDRIRELAAEIETERSRLAETVGRLAAVEAEVAVLRGKPAVRAWLAFEGAIRQLLG